jgi:hypothetical protein
MLVMRALSAIFAEVVVPGVITRVYDGREPAVLARLMPRRDLHDVGYYVVKTRKLVREELMLLSLLLSAYTAYRPARPSRNRMTARVNDERRNFGASYNFRVHQALGNLRTPRRF